MNGPGSTLSHSYWWAPSLYSTWFWVCSVGETATFFFLSSISNLPLNMNKLKMIAVLLYSFHSESLPRSERRPGHVESSRSCESVSSWTKTCMATWSGSLTLKSWMLTERGKVSAVNPPQHPLHAEILLNFNCYSLVRTPAFNEWRF